MIDKQNFVKRKIFALITQSIFQNINRITVDFDANKRSGAVFIGLKGYVVKAHGNCSPDAFESAIKFSVDMVRKLQDGNYMDTLQTLLVEVNNANE